MLGKVLLKRFTYRFRMQSYKQNLYLQIIASGT